MSATLSEAAGSLGGMPTVIDRAMYDRIAEDLAIVACSKAAPNDPDHDHAVCQETPGALLAEHLWRIVAELADGDGRAARIAVRRLDQAMGAGEIE